MKKLVIAFIVFVLLIALSIGGWLAYKYYIYDYESKIIENIDEYFEDGDYSNIRELKDVLKIYKNSNIIDDIRSIATKKIETKIHDLENSKLDDEELENACLELMELIEGLHKDCYVGSTYLIKDSKYEELIEKVEDIKGVDDNTKPDISYKKCSAKEEVSKAVSVKVEFKGDLRSGYALSNYMLEMDEVIIGVCETDIIDIDYVILEVDVTDLGGEKPVTVDGKFVKPEGAIRVVPEGMSVILEFGAEVSKNFVYDDILIKNAGKELTVMATDSADLLVEVEVRGTSEVLAKIDEREVIPYIDLEGYGVGPHTLPIMVDVVNPLIRCICTDTIKIGISSKYE